MYPSCCFTWQGGDSHVSLVCYENCLGEGPGEEGERGVFRVEVVHSGNVNLVGLSVYSELLVNGAITYAIIREPLYSEVFLPLSSFFSCYKQ